jgi:hypothetical protein
VGEVEEVEEAPEFELVGDCWDDHGRLLTVCLRPLLLGRVADRVFGWIINRVTALAPVSGALGYVSRLMYR